MYFLLLFILSATGFAVEEENYEVIYEEFRNQDNHKFYKYTGRRDQKISYLKYGEEVTKKGSIIIAVGRSEPSLNYLETAYDLYQRGYSPIYITSHRGQGYSDRRLNDHFRGYVRHFAYYAQDLNKLIKIIKSEIKETKLFMIAHSMGGAVAVDYLQKFQSQVEKVVLVAPMIKIKLEDGESGALQDTFLACYIPLAPYCTDYVPNGGPPIQNPQLEDSEVTTSQVRFDFLTYLTQTDPMIDLGSATIRWVRTSILANQKMRKQKNIDKIKTPMLLIQAGKDTIVDNSGQDSFCNKTSLCKKLVFPHSLHNPLLEIDKIRNKTMLNIYNFLK